MPKATLTLPSGAVVTLEGTPEEVHRLLEMFSGQTASPVGGRGPKRQRVRLQKALPPSASSGEVETPDINDIVNLVKNCEESEAIEQNILDRASTVDRVLLPLYVVHEHKANRFGLTSGEISRITTELGVRVTQPNASVALGDTASRYVIGDKVRKKGQPVRYRLSRRGLQYIKSVILGTSDGD